MVDVESSCAIRPEEFAVVQRVFKKIVTEDWFPHDPSRQQEFGSFVVRAYQGGNRQQHQLYDLCLRTAKERFASA